MENSEKNNAERKLLRKLNPDRKISSIFGLLIIHPHSGKVNRSTIETMIKHKAAGYNGQTTEQNVQYLKKYANEYLRLSDVNNKITGHFKKMPDYDINGNLH